MPPTSVKPTCEEFLSECAKCVSRSSFGKNNYRFVIDRFKKLRDGETKISDSIREWEREHELPKVCVYCGSSNDLSTDHLIPCFKMWYRYR